MPARRTPTLDLKAIGARIRALRGTELQEELAPKIGISQGQLSKIESGRMPPALEALVKLANRFEKTIDWLVTGHETH
jgi:transcriptional regulator with XRE-family HTH domain